MPFVQIFALEGRTADQKRELVRAVTRSVCEAIAVTPEDVQVVIVDTPRENWGTAGVLASDPPPAPRPDEVAPKASRERGLPARAHRRRRPKVRASKTPALTGNRRRHHELRTQSGLRLRILPR